MSLKKQNWAVIVARVAKSLILWVMFLCGIFLAGRQAGAMTSRLSSDLFPLVYINSTDVSKIKP